MNNSSMKRIVKVGSRMSLLAKTQTQMVIDLLENRNPDMEFQLVTMDKIGDKLLNLKLSQTVDTSLFTKELELALMANEVDFVVHSLKDVPTVISKQFVIGSISARESCDDAVVLRLNSEYQNLESLPEGSMIGTSSARRIAQLKRKYPHLKFSSMRGNLTTRLMKLDDPEKAFQMNKGDNQKFEAIILAKAGLERLAWDHRISEVLSYEDTFYAVGQGALACECRRNDIDIRKLLADINDETSMLTCIAERSFICELKVGYSAPFGVRSTLKENRLVLQGCLLNGEGTESVIVKSEIDLVEKSNQFLSKTCNRMQAANGDSGVRFTGVEIYGIGSLAYSKMEACVELGLQMAANILLGGGDKILKEFKPIRVKPATN